MNMLLRLSILFLVLSGCSTASVRLMPGEKGINKVVARDIEIEGAEQAARKAAKSYCEDKNSSLIVLKEKSVYTGQMDEKTRSGIRSASRAVSLRPGDSTLSKMGSSGMDDRDYQAGLLFKCQRSNL